MRSTSEPQESVFLVLLGSPISKHMRGEKYVRLNISCQKYTKNTSRPHQHVATLVEIGFLHDIV